MKNQKRFVNGALTVLLLCLAGAPILAVEKAEGSLRLAPVFTDNMVLQRDRLIPVWGWAKPGEQIAVSIQDRTAVARAGEDGKWKAVLEELPVGGPYEMTIAGEESIVLKNVLVGEVWVCSGQSNMQMPVMVGGYGVKNGQEEVAKADYPKIRLFTVPMMTAAEPQEDFEGKGWVECSPETVPAFTAVGYFFGRQLHQDLGIPVGLIHSSWGGTLAEAWTSAAGLRTLPDFKPGLDEVENLLKEHEDLQAAREAKIGEWVKSLDDFDLGSTRDSASYADPERDVSDWKVMDLPQLWDKAGLEDYDGFMWFRREVEIPAEWAGKDFVLHLGPVNDWDRTFFNGTKIGAHEVPGEWDKPREYTVPGSLVKAGRNAIAVRVYDMGNRGGICGKPEEMCLQLANVVGMKPISLAGEWRYKEGSNEKTRAEEPKLPREVGAIQNTPTVLFNAMISPLVPYAIRGAIWYQGESNAGRAYQYRTLFPTTIVDWRRHWNQGDFPFLFVQLANFQAVVPEPDESDWAELREAQMMTLRLPNTGMACAIDIGEATDIHPRNKQDVGKRLALAARHVAYGERLVYSGPLYRSMDVVGDRIRLHFRHVGGGLAAKDGEELKGFAIAGKDGKFVWAKAKIDGDTVVVWNDEVPEPAAVHYAWANNPVCNLVNREGLPASPFRTGSWPGIPPGEK